MTSGCEILDSDDIEIGVDCIEISRFREQQKGFFKKVFTDKEITYCESKGNPLQHYAVKFAGKEAVVKALHPFGVKLAISEIEIINDEEGRPNANVLQKLPHSYRIKISLSHSDTMAIAVAVVQTGG